VAQQQKDQKDIFSRLSDRGEDVIGRISEIPGAQKLAETAQQLKDRMDGVPLLIDARMQPQSILYTTLSLFGITCVAVAVMFGIVVVWVRRSGTK